MSDRLKSPKPYGYVLCDCLDLVPLYEFVQLKDGRLRKTYWVRRRGDAGCRNGPEPPAPYPPLELRLVFAVKKTEVKKPYPYSKIPVLPYDIPHRDLVRESGGQLVELSPAELERWKPKLKAIKDKSEKVILLEIEWRDRYRDFFEESSSEGIKNVKVIQAIGFPPLYDCRPGETFKIDFRKFPRPFRGVGSPYQALHEYIGGSAYQQFPLDKLWLHLLEMMSWPLIESAKFERFNLEMMYMVRTWWEQRELADKGIEMLNEFERDLAPKKNALEEFIFSILDSFLTELTQNKQVIRCLLCYQIIRYRKGKKYCSPLADGRDCGKKARSKKYYERHKGRLKEYYRQEMKETRKEYTKVLKKTTDPTENPTS